VRAIEHADICILIIDATRGFEGQDQSIFWLAEKNRKGCILVNKWDLVEKKRCQLVTMKKKSEKN
jgi:GTP-binding protein